MYETFPNIQEERELLPEIFSISSLCSKPENEDFNINLSNTEEANNSNKSPSHSLVFRLNNLEKLLDQELSQSQEDPIREIPNNFSEGRLSKMSEKEAAIYYEKRRNELFRGFKQGKTPIEKAKKPLIHNNNNLKEFVVYNPNPKKPLQKSNSQYKKPIKDLKNEKPKKNKDFPMKSNQNIRKKDFPISESSIKAILTKKTRTFNTMKSLTVIEKKPLILMIDLRKLKKQLSNNRLLSSSSKPLNPQEKRLKITRISRNCSLILEEETNIMKEEPQNRSRSFSFNSYMNTTTEKASIN